MAPKEGKKTVRRKPQAVDEAGPMASLRRKLKTADPEIRNYVAALETENLKCAKTVGKLEAENMTLNNRIAVLIEQNEKQEGKTLAEILSRAGARLSKATHKNTSEGET